MGKAIKIWIGKKTQSLRKSFVDHLIFSLAKNGGRKVAEASTEKSLHCNQEKKKILCMPKYSDSENKFMNMNIALSLKWFAQLEGNI